MGALHSIPTFEEFQKPITFEEFQKTLTFEKCSQETFTKRIYKFSNVCLNKEKTIFTFKNESARQAAVSFMLMVFSDNVISNNSNFGSFIKQNMDELQNPNITDQLIQLYLNTRIESEKWVWGLSDKSFDTAFKLFMNIPNVADYF